MKTLRRLYELEARTNAPHTLKQAAPSPSKPTHLDGTLVAAMRNIKVKNSKILQDHERRIADLEHRLNTPKEPNTRTPDPLAPAQVSDQQKKKMRRRRRRRRPLIARRNRGE